MEIYNRTNLTSGEVICLPVIGCTVSKWRGRLVTLREHPTDPSRVISEGVTFDGSMKVIADEERSQWATALDYIARGRVYSSE
jgi:YD repeat-containing protein